MSKKRSTKGKVEQVPTAKARARQILEEIVGGLKLKDGEVFNAYGLTAIMHQRQADPRIKAGDVIHDIARASQADGGKSFLWWIEHVDGDYQGEKQGRWVFRVYKITETTKVEITKPGPGRPTMEQTDIDRIAEAARAARMIAASAEEIAGSLQKAVMEAERRRMERDGTLPLR